MLKVVSAPELGIALLNRYLMRQSGTWMTIWDDRIAETLRADGPMSVGKLASLDDIRVSKSTVSRRCNKLAENGLIVHIGNGVYGITEEGEGYLDGEYDAENGVWMRNGDDNGAPSAGEQPGEI